MGEFHDHEAGNNLDENVEDGPLDVGDFDFTEEVESPMQSQFENLDADTEELDIPHFVGDLRALMVDDTDDEVVLDSDDEAFSEQKEVKVRGRIWRRAGGIGTPSFEVCSSAGSNLTDKVTDNGPSSVHAEARYQELLVGRSRERNLLSNNENVVKADQDWYGRKGREDNIGSRDTGAKSSKGDEIVNLKSPSINFEDVNEAVDDSVVRSDTKLAFGCYDESQEPGEASEANALDFVDRYLSISVVNSSPEVKIPKSDGRSPLASCVKGPLNMAMKANLLTKIGISTFEWDDDQPDHGGEFFLNKKKELDIQRRKHLGGSCKKGLQESILVSSMQNSNTISKVLLTDEAKRDSCCVNKFDEQFQESSKWLPGNGKNERDAPDMFDVGFDTQMAAEAMEALLYAPPPGINANGHDGLKKTPSDTLKGATTKKTFKEFSSSSRANCDPQNDGINFKQKRVTNQSHQISTSFHKHSQNASELCLGLPIIEVAARGGSLTENRMDGDNFSEPKKAHKKSQKVVGQKMQKEDSDKENIRGGFRKRGRIPQEVKTIPHVACQDRRVSSKRSKKTEDTTCNLGYIHGKQVDALDKKKRVI